MATANKQVVCNVLMELAKEDKDIVVLCSDSRGSGSMTPFADALPEQFIEVGIAEQSLVSMAAGLANAGKKPVAVSPASFLSTRSMEQVKVDCAYSHMNVKLLGISGGVSYGALGMTHHSTTNIATIICGNDTMACGAAAACADAGRTDIKIIGVDGSDDAAALIKSGQMVGTALQQCALIAEMAVEQAHYYINNNGATLDGVGEKQLVPCIAITAENVDNLSAFVYTEG